MTPAKILVILILVYVGVVVTFESLIGYFQPAGQATLVITTTDGDGNANDRVLSRLDKGEQLYVAANHWPRAWFNQALENPNATVLSDSEDGAYLAVPVTEAEHNRVDSENSLGVVFRILTGFPARYSRCCWCSRTLYGVCCRLPRSRSMRWTFSRTRQARYLRHR